ncbi:hypothetical protein OUZ56_024127 [Daphnia magna]|uniref:Ankyrin repeat protein n=1 Tax=Daphnia magna TaxID=35525 RepID=A0ABR0B078_9CRUS|nr:hypothetical protein OUZ56_024127 [Daphnia magna]
MEMEQLNILNDLVGRINEGEGKELPNILVTEEQDNQIGNINIYEEGMTIAHRAATDNNFHLLRILSHHGNIFNIQNSMGEPSLLVAIALNNMECVKYLWMDGIIVHQTLDEETVLHYAAKYNNKFVAKVCPAEFNNRRSRTSKETALQIAVRYRHTDIIEILLRRGARDDNINTDGRYAQDYIDGEDSIRNLFRKF